MPKKAMNRFIIPAFYVLGISGIIVCILLISNTLNKLFINDNYLYVSEILSDGVVPVVQETSDELLGKPYMDANVKISKTYYDYLGNESDKAKSLIYYESTYMQNTGILYYSEKEFDVISVYDGVVTSIKEDDILGNIVEINHNTNLTTIYQCLSKVNVSEGDNVVKGEILGASGKTNIDKNANQLLFEVYQNGIMINPNNIYDTNIEDY